jgi:dihydrofolate reductase
MKDMKNIVVAYDKEFAIGKDGQVPWHLRSDLEHFKEITVGGTVIMGRKTYESLPSAYRPLRDRQNIVLSLSMAAESGFQVARSLEEAYALAEREEIHVIGGAQVYREALPTVDRLYVTEVATRVPGANVHFPLIDHDIWQLQQPFQGGPQDNQNDFVHFFKTFVRKHPIT